MSKSIKVVGTVGRTGCAADCTGQLRSFFTLVDCTVAGFYHDDCKAVFVAPAANSVQAFMNRSATSAIIDDRAVHIGMLCGGDRVAVIVSASVHDLFSGNALDHKLQVVVEEIDNEDACPELRGY